MLTILWKRTCSGLMACRTVTRGRSLHSHSGMTVTQVSLPPVYLLTKLFTQYLTCVRVYLCVVHLTDWWRGRQAAAAEGPVGRRWWQTSVCPQNGKGKMIIGFQFSSTPIRFNLIQLAAFFKNSETTELKTWKLRAVMMREMVNHYHRRTGSENEEMLPLGLLALNVLLHCCANSLCCLNLRANFKFRLLPSILTLSISKMCTPAQLKCCPHPKRSTWGTSSRAETLYIFWDFPINR